MRNLITRARSWYEASDWSHMSRRDLAWHLGTWAASLFCVLVLVVTYFRALEMWPRPMRVVTLAAVVAVTQQWFGYRRNIHVVEQLRDRLDYAELRDAPAAEVYVTDLLATVGPITGPTKAVGPFDWEALDDLSGGTGS